MNERLMIREFLGASFDRLNLFLPALPGVQRVLVVKKQSFMFADLDAKRFAKAL
jgi:hypothetical protein